MNPAIPAREQLTGLPFPFPTTRLERNNFSIKAAGSLDPKFPFPLPLQTPCPVSQPKQMAACPARITFGPRFLRLEFFYFRIIINYTLE